MDDLDRRILDVIQADLPIAARPFEALAERLGADAGDVLARIRRMVEDGPIRRLGPIFDSKRLGYTSTLVAAAVPPERIERIADRVSALPGVTHNYERRHRLNLWFTLTARSAEEIERTLRLLASETGCAFHPLPAEAVYKIRATFDVRAPAPGTREPIARAREPAAEACEPAAEAAGDALPGTKPRQTERGEGGDPPHTTCEAALDLTDEQKHLVRLVQDGLAPVAEPFAPIAIELVQPVAWVLEQLEAWREIGVIRRFGAVVRHRALGYRANGMAAFDVPDERADEAGRRLAERPEATHCYRRPRLAPAEIGDAAGFPFNLYAMLHGDSEDAVRALAARFAEDVAARDHAVLFSVREFKKTSMRYFV